MTKVEMVGNVVKCFDFIRKELNGVQKFRGRYGFGGLYNFSSSRRDEFNGYANELDINKNEDGAVVVHIRNDQRAFVFTTFCEKDKLTYGDHPIEEMYDDRLEQFLLDWARMKLLFLEELNAYKVKEDRLAHFEV